MALVLYKGTGKAESHKHSKLWFQVDECSKKVKENVASDKETLEYIKSLKLEDSKNYDYYRILGIGHLRQFANSEDIKAAYKRACLLYHPDRRTSEKVLEDSQFVFITKAYENLSDSTKRLSYDSVDATFDNSIPSSASEKDFFDIFAPVFERNAVWSLVQPVPLLGDENSTYEHVAEFYRFWKDFQSKREFSLMDDEPVETGDNREEKRYILKMNKKQREDRKKNEIKRIKKLLDNCRTFDPRIPVFMQQKKEREKAIQEEKQQRLKKLRETKVNGNSKVLNQRKKPESNAKPAEATKVTPKKNTVNKKKLIEQAMSSLRVVLDKHSYFENYMGKNYKNNGSRKLENIEEFDSFSSTLNIDEIKYLTDKLNVLEGNDAASAYFNFMKDKSTNGKSTYMISEPKDSTGEPKDSTGVPKDSTGEPKDSTGVPKDSTGEPKGSTGVPKDSTGEPNDSTTIIDKDENVNPENEKKHTGLVWDKDMTLSMMAALKQYPTGTRSRYDLIKTYINSKCNKNLTEKNIIDKIKSVSSSKDKRTVVNTVAEVGSSQKISVRESSASQSINVTNTPIEYSVSVTNWAPKDHKVFQQAIKTFPIGTENRWNKVSQLIPGKSAEDCEMRLRYLCEVLKKKKENQKN